MIMSTNDRKFEVVFPTSWDRLMRPAMEVADKDLLNPNISGKVPLMDGEFVTEDSSYKLVRATDQTALVPAYAFLEWRGDYGMQAAGKAAILKGGTYEADTIVYDATSLVLHSPLMTGAATVGGQTRSGLILRTGSNLIIGYVTRLAITNGGRLRFLQTAV
jgi:hypothetical protein